MEAEASPKACVFDQEENRRWVYWVSEGSVDVVHLGSCWEVEGTEWARGVAVTALSITIQTAGTGQTCGLMERRSRTPGVRKPTALGIYSHPKVGHKLLSAVKVRIPMDPGRVRRGFDCDTR